MISVPVSEVERLNYVIDFAWKVFFEKIISGRVRVNREASMQLHYSVVLNTIGEVFCILPEETFSLELESSHEGRNIDITCRFNDTKAAIELKCFRRKSNRAQDLDMYDVWRDLHRLADSKDFAVRRFICLTDDSRYPNGKHRGYSETFSIAAGTRYKEGEVLVPQWVGRWKNTSRDDSIRVPKDLTFDWVEKNGWFYLLLDI